MDSITFVTRAYTTRPRVETIIKDNNNWEVKSETGCDSNLTVLKNTLLMLICVAGYPISWENVHEEVRTSKISVLQLKICNTFLQPMSDNYEGSQFYMNSNVSSKNNYSKAIDQYKSILTIANISARSSGVYICSDLNRFLANFSTKIQLRVRSLNDKRIVQTI